MVILGGKDRSSASVKDGPIAQSPAVLAASPKGSPHADGNEVEAVASTRRGNEAQELPSFIISHSVYEAKTYTVEASLGSESLRAKSWNGKTGVNKSVGVSPVFERKEAPASLPLPIRQFTGAIGKSTSAQLFSVPTTLDKEEASDASRDDPPCALYSPGIVWVPKGSKLLVAAFEEGSEAKGKGIRPGDILRRVDGEDFLRFQIQVQPEATSTQGCSLTSCGQGQEMHPGALKVLGAMGSPCHISILRVKQRANGETGFCELPFTLSRDCPCPSGRTIRSHFNIGMPTDAE